MIRPWQIIAGIFAVALIVRLVTMIAVLPSLNLDVDLDKHRELARNLQAGKGFSSTASDGKLAPHVMRTPVYSVFLALLMKAGGDRLGWFLFFQCLIGAGTCALTVLLASRWLDWYGAAIAGALVAIDPNSVMRCLELRPETLFTLFIIGGASLLALREKNVVAWCIAGALWGLGALCLPSAVWVWTIAGLVVVLGQLHWRNAAGFLVVFITVIGFWALRNQGITGMWLISTSSTQNYLYFRAAGVAADLNGTKIADVQREIARQLGDIQTCEERLAFQQRHANMRTAASEMVSRAPMLAIRHTLTGWVMAALQPGNQALAESYRKPSPSKIWWPPLYGIALLGAWTLAGIAAKRFREDGTLLVGLSLYFIALAGGLEATSRSRIPVTPTLMILATAGAILLISERPARAQNKTPRPHPS
jgi:hypothetical protein